VHNHIQGVHAAATALLAETATGLAFGWHLPEDKLPLLKSMHVDYVRRAEGGLRAEAHLAPEQIARMAAEERGSVEVACTVTDASGAEPVRCTMTWAWVPRKRRESKN
jgi:acyl-coenzyme A thioesterase PaaI-like protein